MKKIICTAIAAIICYNAVSEEKKIVRNLDFTSKGTVPRATELTSTSVHGKKIVKSYDFTKNGGNLKNAQLLGKANTTRRVVNNTSKKTTDNTNKTVKVSSNTKSTAATKTSSTQTQKNQTKKIAQTKSYQQNNIPKNNAKTTTKQKTYKTTAYNAPKKVKSPMEQQYPINLQSSNKPSKKIAQPEPLITKNDDYQPKRIKLDDSLAPANQIAFRPPQRKNQNKVHALESIPSYSNAPTFLNEDNKVNTTQIIAADPYNPSVIEQKPVYNASLNNQQNLQADISSNEENIIPRPAKKVPDYQLVSSVDLAVAQTAAVENTNFDDDDMQTAFYTAPKRVKLNSDGSSPGIISKNGVKINLKPMPELRTENSNSPNEHGTPFFIQKGQASYYGSKFHGRKTASGERFNMYGYTAAHPTLPFGTKVKVINLHNGRIVMVRINDRGPAHGSRIIDLSKAAADILHMGNSGTALVRIIAYR